MGSLHVLMVDDHRLFRKGVISVMKELRPNWLFSEAENGQEAVRLVTQKKSFQIVLLDVAMPIMDGTEACRRIKQINADLPIIMLTQFDESSLILHLLQLGINGYLLKNTDPEEVVEAIETVVHNGKYITEQMTNALEASIGMTQKQKIRLDLSSRDKEIIQFLCLGMSTKEIAGRMHLTETSVESYRKDLLHKTHTHNVAELISFSHRIGFLPMCNDNEVVDNPESAEKASGYNRKK